MVTIKKAYLKNSLLPVTFSLFQDVQKFWIRHYVYISFRMCSDALQPIKCPWLACASSRFQRDANHTICQHPKSPSIYTSFIIHRSSRHAKRMDTEVHCGGSSRNPQSCWPQHNSCTFQDICSNTWQLLHVYYEMPLRGRMCLPARISLEAKIEFVFVIFHL